ncbi:hypothetical protein BJ508DRAFT_330259 [Ascobolus immersus RN42]|uniref:Cyanovirin-N domain-containing protein n=1 Tax=Ascobolus immersus RN42 TaxID=1160509 RepID=A0A3N4HZN4_ASCIM|nr:hypothetical protein BJ508DRAFT_330259 [Ascobolus immersus RN42]
MKFAITAGSSIITLLSTATMLINAVSAGGYQASCDLSRASLSGKGATRTYHIYCRMPDGQYGPETSINLNTCFANDDGYFVPRLNGGAMHTCTNGELVNHRNMHLRCRPRYVPAMSVNNIIDFDPHFTNHKGVLLCDAWFAASLAGGNSTGNATIPDGSQTTNLNSTSVEEP